MSQIAQQDHLYIEIENPTSLTDAENAKLKECYKLGTLPDVILKLVNLSLVAKVLAWIEDVGELTIVYATDEPALNSISVTL